MCTAVSLPAGGFFFGRTLDYTCSFGEEVILLPRRFPLSFRHGPSLPTHYAFVGMAYPDDTFPLFFDGINEKGLAAAALRFAGEACYHPPKAGLESLPSFEVISRVLAQCATAAQAKALLSRCVITADSFRPDLPPSPLHWLIADRREAFAVESTEKGLCLYPAPAGVLTNAPAFPQQMAHLRRFSHLTPRQMGDGALGLPGDSSSSSRFVRGAFLRRHFAPGKDEPDTVQRFFRLLDGVSILPGSCLTADGESQFTRYLCCCSGQSNSYYYSTHQDRTLRVVQLTAERMDSSCLTRVPLPQKALFLSPDCGT